MTQRNDSHCGEGWRGDSTVCSSQTAETPQVSEFTRKLLPVLQVSAGNSYIIIIIFSKCTFPLKLEAFTDLNTHTNTKYRAITR